MSSLSVNAAPPSVSGQALRVMFCCDPNYYQHLAVALASLLKNNQGRALDVTIVTSAYDEEAESKLVSILPEHPETKVTIRHFGLEKFRSLYTSDHIIAETYLRILALDILPSDCEKIIYLDCDLVVTGPLDGLWETELADYAIAAVPDPYGSDRPAALGMPDSATYVNAGVLLINVKRWREQGLASRVIAYAEQAGSRLRYHDQDAMNAVLYNQTLPLPLRWNCQARMFYANRRLIQSDRMPMTKAAMLAATRDPAVIHFTTSQKPWIFTAYMPKRAIYYRYLAMTAWRDAPPTRRSVSDLPEALYSRIAYICGSSCPFERFLRISNTGRMLVRCGQAISWIVSLLRGGAVSSSARAGGR
jgi:lipopolysaccharide biosynthesis glycosyltransferase